MNNNSGIQFDYDPASEAGFFTLQTEHTTYQFMADRAGNLLHLYYGRKTTGRMDYLLSRIDHGFSMNQYDAGTDRTYSMDSQPLEFAVMGNGDFRSPMLVLCCADGSLSCDFRYESHEVQEGKYSLPGLPAVYADSAEAQSLIVRLKDRASGVRAELLYGVLPGCDVITRAVRIINDGEGTIRIRKIQSAGFDLIAGDYDLLSFYGRHAMERNCQRQRIGHGTVGFGSRRGISSHEYNPFMIIAERETTERSGAAYAFSFVYSGSFRAEAEKDQYDMTRVQIGLADEAFSYPVECGAQFTAPEVILSYSGEGLAILSHQLHRCIREHLCRGKYQNLLRPVVLNSWEALYMDFNGEKLVKLAREGAALGMDLFVLDDGWFGDRNDDNCALGDWTVNEEKLGFSLGELIRRVRETGMKFGIWIEPESVSENSELFRRHPDYALRIPGRDPVRGRNQLLLDFSRREVADQIFDSVCAVLDQGPVDYVKWDLNRCLSDLYSSGAEDQGRVAHDYLLGVYRLLERLLERYPDLLLEGCCGGGGRFDAGMLYYSPQIWCSDNTDAMDRILIHYGTSFGYPISSIGAHVSAVPNELTHRVTPLRTRGIVSMTGGFGYELDPAKLTEAERDEIREQIRAHHQHEELIRTGDYYRLTDPFRERAAAWCYVDENRNEVLLQGVFVQCHANQGPAYIRLMGLNPAATYHDPATGQSYSGAALMECGLPFMPETEEHEAFERYMTTLNTTGM